MDIRQAWVVTYCYWNLVSPIPNKQVIPTNGKRYPRSPQQAIRWANSKMRRMGYVLGSDGLVICCVETEANKWRREVTDVRDNI